MESALHVHTQGADFIVPNQAVECYARKVESYFVVAVDLQPATCGNGQDSAGFILDNMQAVTGERSGCDFNGIVFIEIEVTTDLYIQLATR